MIKPLESIWLDYHVESLRLASERVKERSLLHRRQDNITILHRGVIALQIDRTGRHRIGMHRAAGWTGLASAFLNNGLRQLELMMLAPSLAEAAIAPLSGYGMGNVVIDPTEALVAARNLSVFLLQG